MVSYNTLIKGHAQRGDVDGAPTVVRKELSAKRWALRRLPPRNSVFNLAFFMFALKYYTLALKLESIITKTLITELP